MSLTRKIRARWLGLSIWVMAAGWGCANVDDIEWATVRQGELVVGVEITGTLRAIDSTPVKPPLIQDKWNFKLTSLAPEGTVVKEGDPIAGFDPSEFVRELEQLKNSVESAATQIRNARANARMTRQNEKLQLTENEGEVTVKGLKADQPIDLVSSIELRVAAVDKQIAETNREYAANRSELAARVDRITMEGLRDQLKEAESKLSAVKSNLGKLQLRAPRSGTVIHPSGNGREKIKVGDSVWRMQNVAEIVSIDRMRGEGKVDEADSAKILVGQRVTLRVDSHPENEIIGKLVDIGRSFTAKSESDRSKVIDAMVELEDGHDLPLRPGMRFRGEIESQRIENAIIVPKESVFVGASGAVVYRRDGNSVVRVVVELGAAGAAEIIVKSGLSQGDQVALEVPREAR